MSPSSALTYQAGTLLGVVVMAALATSVPGWTPFALPVVLAGAGLLAWLAIRFARTAAREQVGSDELRRLNERLEEEIEARIADVRDSHARLRSVIDSAVDGIIVIDDRGRVESCNPAAERLFGFAEREVLGRNINMLMPSPYREEHDGYLARYLETGRATIIGTGREVAGLRKDGTTFPLHLSVSELTVGGERKFTGIVHDLTHRVRMEEQLRERAALARLGEMAAVIAHEVKNPLAGVRGAIQVVGSRLPAASGDAPIVGEIVSRIDALDRLINDLLVFARPPRPRLAPVDLAPLLHTTADLMCRDPLLRDVRVDVTGASAAVRADAEMLTIVFQNLLVNAAHAMDRRGTIRVVIGTRPGETQVSIVDAGPGIPPDIRDRVFTAFFTTKARGSGLGLATARRLVEAHHGDIGVECPPGGGTIVVVRLPVLPPEAGLPPAT